MSSAAANFTGDDCNLWLVLMPKIHMNIRYET